jgi:hypothetical protein
VSLELVNAIASVTTAVVIGATAIAAMIQLRHLRANNQITALLAVQDVFNEKDYRSADALVRKESPEIFSDEGFCAYMIAVLRDEEPIENTRYLEIRQASRFVSNTYEALGVLVKTRILDADLVLDLFGWILATGWSNLEGWVAMVRAATGRQSIYENFEYVASLSRDYLVTRPTAFPQGVKRLNPGLSTPAAKLLAQARPLAEPKRSSAVG